MPRNQVQQWIKAERVHLDGAATKASHLLTGGERLEYAPPPRRTDRAMEPEPGALSVLFEDPDFLVLDKPADLAVHPGAGRTTGTLAHRLLQHFPETVAVGGPGRPGIVHRLDKDTTGVLVIARTPLAYQQLSAAFAERRVDKLYLAVVYGRPAAAQGTIDRPIARHPTRRKEMTVRSSGRPARTDYRCLESAAGISLLELDLATGRTHQIRVHLRSLGHPLVGDPIYGEARWKGLPRAAREPLRKFSRPALHAWRLGLEHPVSGRRLCFEAPVPADLRDLWEAVTGSPLPV